MNKPKKILFISCSAGAGHKRAAESLCSTCANLYPDIETAHIDLIDYSTGLIHKTASGYHFMAKHLPELYGLLYAVSDFSLAAKILNLFGNLVRINTRKLNLFVEKFAPDRIICTHFLAAALLKNLPENTPVDMLITDYELNRVVLDPKIRQFYAPTVEIADEITALKRTAYGTGIPVHPDFFNIVDKKQTLSDFKLNAEWPTILVMAGGLGLTDSSKLVKYLVNTLEDTNIVAIAGKSNPRSLNKLKKITPNGANIYRVIDFTERIAELMRLSSIIITKPGGLTVTESLHLKKPLLLFSPVPGQEDANVRYLEEKKYGRLFSGHTDLLQNINSILRGTHDFCEPSLPPNSAENILKYSLNP